MAAVYQTLSSTFSGPPFNHIIESMVNARSHQENSSVENDELSKIFEDSLSEYPDIIKYINEFQVKLNKNVAINWRFSCQKQNMKSNDINKSKCSKAIGKPSIIVFKKKKLNNIKVNKGANIYEHNLSKPDIDIHDNTKSKVSCLRCRKFKKKCTRSLPECSNCVSSDELCIYLPRKMKHSKKDKIVEEREDQVEETMNRKDSTFSNKTDGSSFSGLPVIEASTIQSPFALPSIDRVFSPSLIPDLGSMKYSEPVQPSCNSINQRNHYYNPIHLNGYLLQKSDFTHANKYPSAIKQGSYPSSSTAPSNYSHTKKRLSDFDKILN